MRKEAVIGTLMLGVVACGGRIATDADQPGPSEHVISSDSGVGAAPLDASSPVPPTASASMTDAGGTDGQDSTTGPLDANETASSSNGCPAQIGRSSCVVPNPPGTYGILEVASGCFYTTCRAGEADCTQCVCGGDGTWTCTRVPR
jgi:hypothetical protein